MNSLMLVKPSKVLENLNIAQQFDIDGEYSLAMLHLNAACYWAITEMPHKAEIIREQTENYRNRHFVRKASFDAPSR
jgi:hypothetical protein